MPWWAAGLSIFGTALSAITFMAIPAKAYSADWSYIWLNAGILLVAPLIIYFLILFLLGVLSKNDIRSIVSILIS